MLLTAHYSLCSLLTAPYFLCAGRISLMSLRLSWSEGGAEAEAAAAARKARRHAVSRTAQMRALRSQVQTRYR